MIPATIFSEFSHSARAAGSCAALIASRGAISFRDVLADVCALASHFAASSKTGAIAVLSEDPGHFLTAFLACAALGRPALVLDPALPPSQIRRHAELYCPAVFAVDEKFAEPFASRSPLLLHQRPASAPISLPEVDSEAEFYWGLTAGTTGEPKLFARSQRSWLKSFEAAEQVFSFPSGSQILIPGPLSHSLFLFGAVHALCRGHTVIAPGVFRPDRAAATAKQATHLYVVPFMLTEMLNAGMSDNLRTIFCGGAKLPPELRKRCRSLLPHADLVEFYGASETSFISWHSTKMPSPDDSVGGVFPSVSIEIRSPKGEPLTQGVEGEIYVKSPMLFARYVGGPPSPEWFTVGDIGFTDRGGFLHLTGRKNRSINSKALKIRPEPIEHALLELPGVLRAAVIEMPDAKRGSIAVAAIEFECGKALSRGVVSRHCRTKLGAGLSPHRFYAAELLPMTSSGKIALARLRQALISSDPGFYELI